VSFRRIKVAVDRVLMIVVQKNLAYRQKSQTEGEKSRDLNQLKIFNQPEQFLCEGADNI